MGKKRIALAFAAAMGVLGGGLAYWRVVVMPDDCASALLRARVHDILVAQFGLPENVRYVLPRTLQGGTFATRFLCEAELVNDLASETGPGKPPRIVVYDSYTDAGTHNLRVGIRPGPR